jgi:uncharacterized protein (DUF1778 family)
MPTISVRMTERDDKLIKKYAEMHNISVSDLIRNAVIEKIENEIDIKSFDNALAKMKESYSLSEVKKELGL